MNIFDEPNEEDNNPFIGTNHLYASGIAAVPEGEDDFVPSNNLSEIQEESIMSNKLFEKENSLYDISHLDENNLVIDTEVTTSHIPEMDFRGIWSNDEKEQLRIIDTGKFRDSFGSYAIGYTIKYDKYIVIRRYSEFDSLRQALVRLLPTIIIPPIPSKHPLIKYFLNPLNAESDLKIIDKRKRLLTRFLNNCYSNEEIRKHIVFQKFLNPEYIWKQVLNSPPISILPINNLLAPPLHPTKPSPLHLLLPSPTSISKNSLCKSENLELEFEKQFIRFDSMLVKYNKSLRPLHKTLRDSMNNFQSLATALANLGAYYNAFSLENNIITKEANTKQLEQLSKGIEKIGQAVDVNYVSCELLTDNIAIFFDEPVTEMIQFISEAHRVLKFRKLKQEQFLITQTTIKKRQNRIKTLTNTQEQINRLEEALRENAQDSPTVAHVVKKMEKLSTKSHENKQQWSPIFRPNKNKYSNPTNRSKLNYEVDPHLLTQEEREHEIEKLTKELTKLDDCYELIINDMKQVNESMLKTFNLLFLYLNNTWNNILRVVTRSLLLWLKDCLSSWQNAKSIIDNIQV